MKAFWNEKQKMPSVVFILCLLTVCTLSGCQKTPEKAVVVDKSEGLSKEAIIDPQKEGEKKEIDVPVHWQETMGSEDNRVSLSADIAVQVPEISNTPVWQVKQNKLTEKKLKKLTDYFAGDAKLYEVPAMTKAEIQEFIDEMDNKEGFFLDENFLRDEQYERAKEMLEKAPEQVGEKVYVQPKFTNPVKREYETIMDVSRPPYTAMDMVLTEENTFEAMVEKGQKFEPSILATTSNKKAGSTSNFRYTDASLYSEGDLKEEEEILAWEQEDTTYYSREFVEAHKNRLERIRIKFEQEASFSVEEAREEAEKILTDLDMTGMRIDTEEKVLVLQKLRRTDLGWKNNWEQADIGYFFIFAREMDGLRTQSDITTETRELPEKMYSAPFDQETIRIGVSQKGIVRFEWENMAKVDKVIAENTKLLPFDEIKEKLLNHVYYTHTSENPEQNEDSSVLTIVNTVDAAELMAVYSTAYEEPDKAWLVPAWVFTVNGKFIFGGTEQTIMEKTIAINAIDGGFINGWKPKGY